MTRRPAERKAAGSAGVPAGLRAPRAPPKMPARTPALPGKPSTASGVAARAYPAVCGLARSSASRMARVSRKTVVEGLP